MLLGQFVRDVRIYKQKKTGVVTERRAEERDRNPVYAAQEQALRMP